MIDAVIVFGTGVSGPNPIIQQLPDGRLLGAAGNLSARSQGAADPPPPPGLSPPRGVPPLANSSRARIWGNQSHKMEILVFYKHWQRDADTRGGFGHRARAHGCAPGSGSGFGMLHLAPIPSPGYVPLCHSRRHLLLRKLGSSPFGGGGLRSCRPMRAAGTRVPPQPEVVHGERGFVCPALGVLLHPPVLREGWSGVPGTPAMGDTSLGGTVSSSKGTCATRAALWPGAGTGSSHAAEPDLELAPLGPCCEFGSIWGHFCSSCSCHHPRRLAGRRSRAVPWAT